MNGTGPKDHETTTPAGIIPRSSLESFFRLSLESKCPIPLDLLDLMDVGHPFGTSPQVYARGLMKEVVRQLDATVDTREKSQWCKLSQVLLIGAGA